MDIQQITASITNSLRPGNTVRKSETQATVGFKATVIKCLFYKSTVQTSLSFLSVSVWFQNQDSLHVNLCKTEIWELNLQIL